MNIICLLLLAAAAGADPSPVPTQSASGPCVDNPTEGCKAAGLLGCLRGRFSCGKPGCSEPACPAHGYGGPGIYARFAEFKAMPYTCPGWFAHPGSCCHAPAAPLPAFAPSHPIASAVVPPSPTKSQTLPTPKSEAPK
jgi:hypothetical protein